MLSETNEKVIVALKAVLTEPTVESARALEKMLSDLRFERKVFGRLNQKSSIEAASESDRGIAEGWSLAPARQLMRRMTAR